MVFIWKLSNTLDHQNKKNVGTCSNIKVIPGRFEEEYGTSIWTEAP